MGKTCNKAQLEKCAAVYILGQLIIWAEGQRPTPCHEPRVEQWPFRIYPPQYQVVTCIDDGVICPQVLASYRTATAFSISEETFKAMAGFALVHHRDGTQKVPVKVIKLPKERTELLTAGQAADGVPGLFDVGATLPFPFRFAKLLETGRGEDIEFFSGSDVAPHTATGYSNTFSFTEAFQNAVSNLPPDTNPFPDKLTNVRVVSIGADYGGIAGLNRLFVKVLSFY